MLQTKIKFIKSKKIKQTDFVKTRESTSEIRRYKETLAKKSKLKRIIDELSTESEDSDLDNSIELLNDVSEKTTCKAISYKSNSNETVCVGSDDVIFISSDETSKETAHEKSKLKKKKTKRKKHSKKKK